MNDRQIQSLISLFRRLQKQKYPLIVIVIIVAASLLANGDWLNSLFPTAADECEVVKIYDGDTMTLQCSGQSEKTRVRMYCIDTPEMKQAPWGTEARDHLRSITGATVKVVEVDKDRYGRIVGEVYSGETNLNLAQVKAGKAAVYDAYCKKPEYKTAEAEAKQNQLGIWSQTGLHQTPWEWRKQQRQ
jgi:micrococcal nuclease